MVRFQPSESYASRMRIRSYDIMILSITDKKVYMSIESLNRSTP